MTEQCYNASANSVLQSCSNTIPAFIEALCYQNGASYENGAQTRTRTHLTDTHLRKHRA